MQLVSQDRLQDLMFESLTLDQKKAVAVVCAAALLLDDEPERPNKPRVGQEVLPSDPKTESTWATIWAKGDDRTLVKIVNLDRESFELLLTPFAREFRLRDTDGVLLVTKKNKTGRRQATADGCLLPGYFAHVALSSRRPPSCSGIGCRMRWSLHDRLRSGAWAPSRLRGNGHVSRCLTTPLHVCAF